MENFINNAPFALVLVCLVIGFVLLIKGADFFVEGSSSAAKRLHVPSIIIGLTIVAMGTSLPETAVSVSASLTGNNELAVSNVIGSNIFNLMVVIGVCAVLTTVEVAKETIKRDIPLSLICAGLFTANGNRRQDTVKISMGFLLGDLWAYIAVWVMETLQWNPNVELYATLFILGGLAVIIGETFSGIIFTPSWLCGWAIGLTIMGPMKVNQIGTLPIQIGAAMLAGVLYVGVGVDAFQRMLVRRLVR